MHTFNGQPVVIVGQTAIPPTEHKGATALQPGPYIMLRVVAEGEGVEPSGCGPELSECKSRQSPQSCEHGDCASHYGDEAAWCVKCRAARSNMCEIPPAGWWCSCRPTHEGPCAARPLGPCHSCGRTLRMTHRGGLLYVSECPAGCTQFIV